MFAYLISRRIKGAGDDFKQWEQVAPLLSGGPYTAIPRGDETLIIPRWLHGDKPPADVVDLSAFADPVEVCEGVRFLSWKDTAPTSGELLRPAESLPMCIDVDLERGERVVMPIAAGSSRAVLFRSRTTGDVVDEYATKAQIYREKSIELSQLWQKQSDWSDGDSAKAMALNEEVLALNIEVVCLGLKRAYRVTEDVLEALGWVTSSDLERLGLAALGVDPLALECQG